MNTPIYADLDQIVFEGRSKDYGAYDMRKRYNRVLTRAMLITFLLFISITGLPKMIAWIMPDIEETAVVDEPVIIATEVELEPKPPKELEVPNIPQPQPPSDVAVVNATVPVPKPEELLKEEQLVAEIDAMDSVALGTSNKDGDKTGDYVWPDIDTDPCPTCPPAVTVVPKEDDDLKPDTFILLEKEPQAVNLDELGKLIGYPEMAKEAEIQGRVTLRVMVDKMGNYVKHIVLKDPHPILTRAVTEKIHLLKMTPGIQAGKPIKVWVTLPFNFELNR
jgi:protein TonB